MEFILLLACVFIVIILFVLYEEYELLDKKPK